MPPKAQGRREKGNKPEPISGLDIDALLNQPHNRRNKITIENSIPEFWQMMDRASEDFEIEDAAKQMGDIIRSLVKNSLGISNYDRAIENISVFRKAMMKWERPDLFNSFLKDFKERLDTSEFNGNRRELWRQIKGQGNRLGLIDQDTSEPSNVTRTQAAEVSAVNLYQLSDKLGY